MFVIKWGIYVQARCRGEPCVRPRTNNAFIPMYDGRTQGSPLHVLGTYVNEEFIFRVFLSLTAMDKRASHMQSLGTRMQEMSILLSELIIGIF